MILAGAQTFVVQAGFAAMALPMWHEGWRLWIDSGRYAPFAAVSTVICAVYFPLAIPRIVAAAQAAIPFLKK